LANNIIYIKRTSVSGRTPNTTGSYSTNSQYIATGELALNLTDNKMFTSNGTSYFEIGANLINQNVTGNIIANSISAGSNTNSGTGISGYSNSNYGTQGVSNSNYGVVGFSTSGGGGYFSTLSYIGVQGISNSYFGVYGQSNISYGVYGISTSSFGVAGTSNSSVGGYFTSNSQAGVQGTSNTYIGVYGTSNSIYGVYGTCGSGYGTVGNSNTGIGIYGTSISGIGAQGISNSSYGGYFVSNNSNIAAFANNTVVASYIDNNGVFVGTANNANNLGTVSSKAFPYTLGQSTIPIIMVSSGTMAGNGAITLTTALDNTYSACYIWLPTGAISTGSSANLYYTVFSNTTAGIVYNNVYSNGTPTIISSPTAFNTTGPGAYTQTTAAYINAYSVVLPGNALGINGGVDLDLMCSYNNSAGAKTVSPFYSTYKFGTMNLSTTTGFYGLSGFTNKANTNAQINKVINTMQTGTTTSTTLNGAINSTANQNITIQLELATATDWIALQRSRIIVFPGV
jgi:hypothetical protein